MNTTNRFSFGRFIQQNMAWVLLIIVCLIFGFTSDHFFTLGNILNILNQNAFVVVASLGLTFLMMSGAIDLSVGWVMSTCGVICAIMMSILGWPMWVAIPLTILFSISIALLNTFLAIKLKLLLLVVSIASMTIFSGVSFILSQARSISGFPAAFRFIGTGRIFGVHAGVYIAAICFVVMSFVLNRTHFGRYVYALGGNEEAARLAGINVKRVRYTIAIITGFFVGLASIMLIARIGVSQSQLGPGTEFVIITGVFLGGVSIRGGEGRLSGVLAGILCVSILYNGMQLAGINVHYQSIAKGVILIAAIGFDRYQLSRRNMVKKEKKEKQTQ
ncbi:MAG: ABC transporter permease [Oscillospiraceae bacterium]|nr:ABC transporter permease [Oscillospiraceae bacterium]